MLFGTGAGIADVMVFLDANHNGVLDSNEMFTFTDANGNYTFSGLLAGDYEVTEVLPPKNSLRTVITLTSCRPAEATNGAMTRAPYSPVSTPTGASRLVPRRTVCTMPLVLLCSPVSPAGFRGARYPAAGADRRAGPPRRRARA